jgi:hypothetical protein
MSFFGGSSSPPAVTPAPPMPTSDTAEVAARRKAEAERIRKMRGRRSTILTGGQGAEGEAEVGRKSLLGE